MNDEAGQPPIDWVKIFNSVAEADARIKMHAVVRVHLGRIKRYVVLTRTASGYHACQDECPHKAVSFARGYSTDHDEIVCPWHNYRFDLETGMNTSFNGCRDLQIYPVKADETGLYIGIYNLLHV